MRTPNLGSIIYAAGDPTGITTIEEMVKFIREREVRCAAAIQALAAGHIDQVNAAPLKPREGDLRLADGTNWDPGLGQGAYIYYAAAWHKMG